MLESILQMVFVVHFAYFFGVLLDLYIFFLDNFSYIIYNYECIYDNVFALMDLW